jgi:hypothetical protein
MAEKEGGRAGQIEEGRGEGEGSDQLVNILLVVDGLCQVVARLRHDRDILRLRIVVSGFVRILRVVVSQPEELAPESARGS